MIIVKIVSSSMRRRRLIGLYQQYHEHKQRRTSFLIYGELSLRMLTESFFTDDVSYLGLIQHML